MISCGDIAGHVVEVVNRLKSLLDWFIIRGNRTTAQQTVQLIVSCHELAIQCVPEDNVLVMTKQLMVNRTVSLLFIEATVITVIPFFSFLKMVQFCLLQGLESLHLCASSSVVHWYLVLLSRVYLGSEAEVAGPVWAVLKKIIIELEVSLSYPHDGLCPIFVLIDETND